MIRYDNLKPAVVRSRWAGTVRNIAIGLLRLTSWTNIAAGQRHHARNPPETIKCLLTS